jgi:hypothetical protein
MIMYVSKIGGVSPYACEKRHCTYSLLMNGSPTLALAGRRFIVVCIGVSIGLPAGTGGGACAGHLILVNIISGHRRRRSLNQPPASLGRISVIPHDADIR